MHAGKAFRISASILKTPTVCVHDQIKACYFLLNLYISGINITSGKFEGMKDKDDDKQQDQSQASSIHACLVSLQLGVALDTNTALKFI